MREMEQSLLINQLENEVENQLKEVLAVFQNLPEEILLQPSATGGWSIAQCFEHLNTYAEFYLPKLKKGIEEKAPQSNTIIFKHTWLGNYFIKMMDIEKSKKKYKAIKKHRPIKIDNPHTAVSHFIQHTENLLTLLKESKKKELRKIYVCTSLSSFIKMNAGDAMRFLLTHNNRHLIQAKRNIV